MSQHSASGRAWRRKRERVLKHSDICWICGLPGADSVDHVIPIARGGTNDESNLKPAHMFPCNRSKSDRDFTQIVRRSGSLA
jgi:5-methylcytosine-specific restriction protein A